MNPHAFHVFHNTRHAPAGPVRKRISLKTIERESGCCLLTLYYGF